MGKNNPDKHRKSKARNLPKHAIEPKDKVVQRRFDPEAFMKTSPSWRFRSVDKDGRWGHAALKGSWWDEIYSKLQDFESMTWAAILEQSGGRTRGTNSHEVPVSNLCKEARKRLRGMGYEVDSIFSLRLKGLVRIYGIREGAVLKLLWFDKKHEIYPTSG